MIVQIFHNFNKYLKVFIKKYLNIFLKLYLVFIL